MPANAESLGGAVFGQAALCVACAPIAPLMDAGDGDILDRRVIVHGETGFLVPTTMGGKGENLAMRHQMGIDLFRDFGALLIMCGAVLTVAGAPIFLRFAAAWGALLFMVPVPGRIRHMIAGPLQQASAAATEWLLVLFGAPVERSGNVLVINGADVAIAEACNGMRMVAALALVSYAFVFSVPMRSWARILLLTLTPVVAILANVLRLVPTSLLYGYSSADTANLFHDIAGWGVLLVALLALWLALQLLRFLELPLAPYAVRERV
jgi:exosortase